MNYPLLLELISEELDIKSVSTLSRVSTSLQTSILCLQSNNWWYRRAQVLLKSTLEGEMNKYWKYVYRTVHCALGERRSPFTKEVLSSVQYTRLLLAYPLGKLECFYRGVLEHACVLGEIEVASLLLNDSRMEATIRTSMTLRLTCEAGKTEIFKLLLQDGRIDPSMNESQVLDDACYQGRTEIVKLLLQDGRADPSAMNSSFIDTACCRGNKEIVRLLLEDGRADPSARNYEAVLSACGRGHQGIVNLLVADPRVGQAGLEAAIARRKK